LHQVALLTYNVTHTARRMIAAQYALVYKNIHTLSLYVFVC
jgi:hypothetical protein